MQPLTPPEIDYIFAVCRWFLGNAETVDETKPLRIGLIFDYLEKNGCMGIYNQYLEEQAPAAAPEIRDYCRNCAAGIAISNDVLHRAAAVVDAACRQERISYIMIKGIALVGSVYRETGLRAFSDIDLIVPSKIEALQLIAAIKGKTSCGKASFSERYKHLDRMVCRLSLAELGQDAAIEIHFPLENSIYLISELFYNISGPLFKNARSAGTIRIPDPSSHFLILLVHLVHHHIGARLIWNLDIACLLKEYGDSLDWHYIIRECTRLEFENVLFHVLSLMKNRFAVAVPENVMEKVRSRSYLNDGILAEMTSERNVVRDSFGGGEIWQYPALSPRKLKTMLLYCLFPLLFNDVGRHWYTFSLFEKRKRNIISELVFTTIFGDKSQVVNRTIKAVIGGVFVFIFSLLSWPFLLRYRITSKKL